MHSPLRHLIPVYLLAIALLPVSRVLALEVTVAGIEGELLNNVRSTASMMRLKELDAPNRGYLARLVAKSSQDAMEALEPFGYYNASVKSKIAGSGKTSSVSFTIAPGPQTKLDAVTVRFFRGPDPVPNPDGVAVGLAPGGPFSHTAYETAKRDTQLQLLELGYLEATLKEHRVSVTRRQNSARIDLAWDLGPRFTFGSVQYSGSTLKPELLNRYTRFKRGEYFRQSALAAMNQRLLESGYFEDVAVNTERQPDHSVNIQVALTHRPRTAYEIGATFGTDSGPGVELTTERRRLNSRGHTALLEADLNQRRSGVELTYAIPRFADADALVNLSTGYVDENTDTSSRQSFRVGAQRLGLWKGWRRTDSLSFLREDFEVGTDEETTSLLIPSVTITKKRDDGTFVPTDGWALRLGLSTAVSGLLSDLTFVQLNADYRRIWSWSDHSRLLTRARLGATWTSDFAELPASLRYFAGGDRNLRGYDFEALGPLDEDGEVEGGKHLVLGSVEYERRVTGPWRLAAFVDGGNAINTFSDDFEFGIGAGVRYETPVGLIRLDLASSVSQDGGFRIHFSIGPDL